MRFLIPSTALGLALVAARLPRSRRCKRASPNGRRDHAAGCDRTARPYHRDSANDRDGPHGGGPLVAEVSAAKS